MSRSWLPATTVLLVALTHAAFAQEPADAGEGLTPEVRERLGLPDGPVPLLLIDTSEDNGYSPAEATANAPDIVSLEAAHLGGQRVLFRVGFASPPDFSGAAFLIYLDVDNDPATGRKDNSHRGVDVMLVVSGDEISLSSHNADYRTSNTAIRGARVGSALYVTLDTRFPIEGDAVPLGVHLLCQRQGGRSDSTRHKVVQLPRKQADLPSLKPGRGGSIRTLDDYRYHDDLVKYEKLEDKGLRGDQVTREEPFEPGRECPEPTFINDTGRADTGNLGTTRVPISLLEEAGVARSDTPVTFGFPCPEGGVYSLDKFLVLDEKGREIPAQFTATVLWPDGSLKWVLVDLAIDLEANEEKTCTLEFGGQVSRGETASPLEVGNRPGLMDIDTGKLSVLLDRQRFGPLGSVSIETDGRRRPVLGPEVAGMVIVDEHGKEFSSAGAPVDELTIEQRGPRKTVVRAEGKYVAADGETYMRYIARLTFRAGSSRVEVAWTHINDYLETEFTDFDSLSLPVTPSGGLTSAAVYLEGEQGALEPHEAKNLTLFQADDLRGTLGADGTEIDAGRAPGIIRCEGRNGAMTIAVHDFWQRWPKGFTSDGQTAGLQLLPPQPGPEYGTDLPHYLLYNLVSGKYRLKWGMTFTERFTVDFDPNASVEQLRADAGKPVVAVLPAEWYAQTGALGPIAAPMENQFAVWDKLVADGFDSHMIRKERTREYGFLNYGDWYGERGRNWGNNEYDLAHGLFRQFLRTGDRDYFRWALPAARHQADVDIIHAYPDAFYIGGMIPHAVGHTGAWSQNLEHGIWHKRYDAMMTGSNGHNWADGMVAAWCLTGEAGIMQSALELAEHITWAMSPTFKALGTHERSAGWSLRTIMSVYRQTYDPEYLAAAGRIAAVALREQKLAQGGGWPHALPLDHARGQAGIVGNNIFLVGILLSGLQAYHEASQDPAVEKSLVAGVHWVAKSWDESAGGWPYSATVDGGPVGAPGSSLNMLTIEPIAYVAGLTGDEKLWSIVDQALAAVSVGGAGSFGKSLAQKIHFSGEILARLQDWYEHSRPDKGAGVLSGDPAWYATLMAKTADATRHSVRAPDQKRFVVQISKPPAKLIAIRSPHGAMNKRSPTGMLNVRNAAGETVGRGEFSTDGAHEWQGELAGQPGDQFEVLIDDDQRGVWTLKGDGLTVVMQTGPGFRFGGVGKGKYYFRVPEGCGEFRVKLVGVHTGPYGAVVLTPGGELAGQHQDANPGSALILGAPKGAPLPPSHPERGETVIQPDAADTGKLWSIVLWAAGDIGVELIGVPPYLSLSEDAWFLPE